MSTFNKYDLNSNKKSLKIEAFIFKGLDKRVKSVDDFKYLNL